MTDTTLTIGLVAVIAACVVTAVSVTWWLSGRFNAVREEAAEGIKEANHATTALKEELTTYRLHAAETFMTKASGGVAIDRAVEAVKEFKEEIGERLHRVETLLMQGDRRSSRGG